MQTKALPSGNTQAQTNRNTLLTAEDVRDRLQVSIRTVRELIAQRKLAIVQIGRSVRIREQDLEAFIEARINN